MNNSSALQAAEIALHDLATELLEPRPRECVLCYVFRMTEEFGCNGTHRFTEEFRLQRAPRATALLRRFADLGACCCECELFLNAYQPRSDLWQVGGWMENANGDRFWVDPEYPRELPACTGVRRGSTQPCELWVCISRRRYAW